MPNLPRPEPSRPFSYSEWSAPPQYHCGKCGVMGVKLWREYQTMLVHQSLLCAKCACAEQSQGGKAYSVVEEGESGRISVVTTYCPTLQPRQFELYRGENREGDQIGWRVPAVPTEDGRTYWGYCSVPPDGVSWWCRLPLSQ